MSLKKHPSPQYSIVIPAYNEASYIAETLLSLENLEFDGTYEVIVVDNNSSDGTADIAASHGAVVVTEKRPGVCWARQCGTDVAKGNIIISADADTTYAANWLTTIDKGFKKHPASSAIAGPCHYVEGPLWGRVYAHVLFGVVATVYATTGRTIYVSGTNIAFKKSFFDGYDTNLPQGGDELDLIRRLKKKGKVRFDNKNPTYTSSRRFERGFVYNLFVSFLFFYILEYNLNRLFGRPILGASPSFRDNVSQRWYNIARLSVIFIVVTFVFISRERIVETVSSALGLV